jgi:methylmalonyl-CoA mutase
MTDLALASEFPTATREAWAALVEKVLKGADFDKKLVSRTYDGIRIEPLYPKAENVAPARRAQHGPWHVAQRVDHPDPKEANALALADLEGGADALVLSLDRARPARGFGLKAAKVEDLDRALSGVMLDLIWLSVESAPFEGRAAAALVAELVKRREHAPGSLRIDFGLDPVADMARTGAPPLPWPDLSRRFAETARSIIEAGYGGTAARIDARPYHEAGASEAQELAAAIATGVTYLRALEEGGLALERARDALSFLLVTDADEFLTVAKFRALRRLWARVEEACGLEPKPLRLQAESAWRMTTRRDPWVNLLRGTMAAFSAGIGGADSVTVLPFTAALGLPDAFARRLARNTQLILLEESNIWRVADPVAGSGAFEALTDELAQEAWTQFQDIEREGGIVASLASGALQRRIAAVRSERDAAIATRRDPLTGTSEFPDIREAAVSVLIPRAGKLGASSPLQEEVSAPQGTTERDRFEPLPSLRSAEPYEALRDRSDDMLASTAARPRVFLANLGPISAFSARATFARNAFEAGGIEAITNDGFGSLDALAAAFAASGARLACLCSSDEIYGAQGAPAARALKGAGATAVYLAGRPGELDVPLKEAGVADFVYVGCNLLRFLEAALEKATA